MNEYKKIYLLAIEPFEEAVVLDETQYASKHLYPEAAG